MKKKLIVANWKMNGTLASNELLLKSVIASSEKSDANIIICPPSIYIPQVKELLVNSFISLGAQDVSAHEFGAYTGEISASMLRDLAVNYVIVGHSERRKNHGETDVAVALKVKRALAAGITPIVCVGETQEQREAEETISVVKRQLAAVIQENGDCISEVAFAYEPLWAIGTGKTATPEMAQEVHSALRLQLQAATSKADSIPILYGGSMNANNATLLLMQKDIDGGLIGGASLKSEEFLSIIKSSF